MARRWTPQRFVTLRRIRVAACVAAVTLGSVGVFGVTARKTVALTVNGETRTVSTYAMSVDRLLQEQGVTVRSHDLVQSTGPTKNLVDHDVVTVRSAYQTTITIDGESVPFWTVATSADQLIGFFEENEHQASRITVDIDNVYSQLTGGIVINRKGPVTVIADGKSSVAPDGKLPAASILDSKGITLGKEDRVSVEQDGGKTVLRVRRVTHREDTRTVAIPFSTRTVIDASLAAGQTVIRQQGVNGEKTQVYDVTLVDGEAESEKLVSEKTTKAALDQIIAVGAAQMSNPSDATHGKADAGTNTTKPAKPSTPSQSGGNADAGDNGGNGAAGDTGSGGSGNSGDAGATTPPDTGGSSNTNPGDTSNDNPGNDTGTNGSTGGNSSACRLCRPSVAQAQAYAAGAAAQYGWTGNDWDCLVKLWTRESSWLWYAENPSSGAYGIPQSLPAEKMAAFGANYREDAAAQIDWGLSYIAGRYGSPSQAWAHSESVGWY